MTNTTKCNKLDPIDSAWIAGFFDGEGWCGVSQRNEVQLTIGQCEREILEWIRDVTGVGAVHLQSDHVSRKQPLFHWRLSSMSEIESFLEEIEGHLRTAHKKEQVEHVLARCESRKCHNGT